MVRKTMEPTLKVANVYVATLIVVMALLAVISMVLLPVRPLVDEGPIIYTCTTFFDSPAGGKWESFETGIRSILHFHPRERVSKWFVINEPGPNALLWKERMASKFPWVQFYQKDASISGQAHSLNIILDQIKPFRFWLQWEESWFATRPFINDAVHVLATTGITQMQLTILPTDANPSWFQHAKPVNTQWSRVPLTEAMCAAMETIKTGYDVVDVSAWPLFSLCPSLNTVAFYADLPRFSTDPGLWPWRFEWEFAKAWARAGGTKAIFNVAPATRSIKHVSTYS